MATRHDHSPAALVKCRRRQAATKRASASGLTPKVKKAIEAMVFGIDGVDPAKPITQKMAAEHADLTDRAVREAFGKPEVVRFYREQIAALREGQRAANLRVAIGVRDDSALRASAAGMKTILEAARQIDHDPTEQRPGGVTVNVGLKVETPGYVLDLREPDDRGEDRRLASPPPFVLDVDE